MTVPVTTTLLLDGDELRDVVLPYEVGTAGMLAVEVELGCAGGAGKEAAVDVDVGSDGGFGIELGMDVEVACSSVVLPAVFAPCDSVPEGSYTLWGIGSIPGGVVMSFVVSNVAGNVTSVPCQLLHQDAHTPFIGANTIEHVCLFSSPRAVIERFDEGV